MAVECGGVLKYVIPTALHGEAAETIAVGESCWIGTDGLIYVCDNGKSDVVHGWAIRPYTIGQEVTLATEIRLNVLTTQTIGARVYSGAVSGGSAPSTTLTAAGVVCGVAESANAVFCRAPAPAAAGN